MSDLLSNEVLCRLADSDIEAMDEYAAHFKSVFGNSCPDLSKAARVRALFRLGVESWRARRSDQTENKTKTT